MNTLNLGTSDLRVPQVALGCMRIAGLDEKAVDALISTAIETGITFFDHADIYGGGKSEEVFAASIARLGIDRSRLIIQDKCGIRSGFFDFSKEHILASVDGMLRRLRTDVIDVLLLHRPDALVEPEEVAEAFTQLLESGKVRHFGVSNHNPGQIKLLQAGLPMRLQANQLQFSITNTGMIDQGLNVNMEIDRSVDRDGGVLDFCRLQQMTVQPWSPLQHGFFRGAFLGSQEFAGLNATLEAIAEQYGVSSTCLAIAWILRHPAKMQPIIGSTNPDRVRKAAEACDVALTRPHWYEIYRAAGNSLP